VVSAFLFTLPMAAWMRIRGMEWRPTVEMSGATVGLAIVVAALYAASLVSDSTLQAWLKASCAPWGAVMFVAMLCRLPCTPDAPGTRRDTTRPRSRRDHLRRPSYVP
jgi:hypothetical protein